MAVKSTTQGGDGEHERRHGTGWRPPGSPPGTTPLGTWIEEEAAAAVRAGELAPGTRLPSVRRLADRLGVHRNTVGAAYRRLEDRGLVRLVHGSGCYVRSATGGPGEHAQAHVERPGRLPGPGPRTDLRSAYPLGTSDGASIGSSAGSSVEHDLPLRWLLEAARERGATTADLADAFRRWDRSLRSGRLLVAAPERELGDVWAAELLAGMEALALEVEPCDPDDLLSTPGPGAPVAAPREFLDHLSEALPPWIEIVPMTRNSGRSFRRAVRGLSREGLVLVVSDSPALRQRLVTLIRLAGPPPIVAGLPSGETDRLRRVAQVARLVVCDLVSVRTVKRWIGETRLAVFRDLAPGSIEQVRRRLRWPGGPGQPGARRAGESLSEP